MAPSTLRTTTLSSSARATASSPTTPSARPEAMDRRNTLVATELLVDELLRWDYPGEERIKYGLLGMSEGPRERRFLLREVVSPPLEEYASRGPASASTRARFVYQVYAQAWEHRLRSEEHTSELQSPYDIV